MSESIKVSKSNILLLMNQGLKAKEIAEKMGISTLTLAKGCKQFEIKLRKKPRLNIEFVDDTLPVENLKLDSVITNQKSLFDDNVEVKKLTFSTKDDNL